MCTHTKITIQRTILNSTTLIHLLHGLRLGRGKNISLHSKFSEQVQVRTVHQSTSNKVVQVVVAGAALDVVVPAGRAHKGAHEHLQDLAEGDEEGGEPLGHHVEGLQAKVAIHDSVHGVVHGYEVQTRSRHGRVRAPAKQQHGHVVVPVQEDKGLSTEHNERSVNQLRNFTKDEKHNPEAGLASTPGMFALRTHSIGIRLSGNHRYQAGNLNMENR